MVRRAVLVIVAALAVLCLVRASSAVFHIVVIDEVTTSYGGDPNVQFIEMRMLAPFQNFLMHSIFAAFDDTGAYIGDILEVPGSVPNSGTNLRWLVGTAAFQSATGLTPDFIIPAGILPTGGGMVCFGGGPGGVIVPVNPPTWDRTDFANYVDCVAYGTYTGSTNALIGTPTPLDGDGHSLQRTGNTHNNAADFACGDPATPANNAGTTVSMVGTTPCGACPLAPDSGCLSTFSNGRLLVKEAPAGKEKLLARFIGGPALTQTDLGNPLSAGGTAHSLCIYDGAGSLVGQLTVNRPGDTCGSKPCWKALGGNPPGGKGYKYRDNALAAAGVRKILYKGGPAGSSKALIRGLGAGLPDGIAAALQMSTGVTVQLRGSDAPQCLSVTLTDVTKHDPAFFKARK